VQVEIARAQALLNKKQPNPDKAIKLLKPLLKRNRKSWMLYHYMGVAMLQKADYRKALDYLTQALQEGANEPESYHLVSVAYHNINEFDEAIRYARQALDRKQDFLEAWVNLGAAYRAAADLDNAMKAYSEANRLDPQNAGIAYRIGSIYFDQGDLKKARELYEITVKMEPEFLEAYLGQSLIHLKLQEFKEAVQKIMKALEIRPNHRLSRIQLAVAFKDWGRYTEAIKLNEQLLKEQPNDGRLRINYALCLLEVGRFNEAERNYMRALKDCPDAPESLSNYLMGIHYNPERTKEEIFEAHLLWDQMFAPKERAERAIPENLDPDKKLRIGFISGGFRKHPVGWMITRAIENLPRDLFEVYCYTTHSMYDRLTMRLRKRSDKWTSVLGYTDKIVAKILKEDEVDILVELSGHSAFNRLKTVALEPVPITIKWVGGLFNTTGMESMDYLLTDHFETPQGEEEFYTEKLVRMPDDYVCYEPPEYDISVGELPALYNGFITFGCFNNPSKLNGQLIEQWSELLQKVEGSKLFLKSKQYDTKEFVESVTQTFSKFGIQSDRLIFEGYAMHEDLLASYNKVDIALDPWPYSGGLTTCEALWMGVPVVTNAGPTFAGRHSVTHLNNAGCGDWVTYSWEDYKSKVVDLASNVDRLVEIRGGLRDQLVNSPLCDGARFGAHLSIAFREMWKQRVDGYEQDLPEGEWQDHISVSPVSDAELDEFLEKHELSKDAPFLISYTEKTVSDTLKIALPKSKENFTHYQVEEGGTSHDSLLKLMREILDYGDSVIEVGAGYGTLTIQLAKLIGKEGILQTFEPNPNISRYLKESIRLNVLNQVDVIESAVHTDENSTRLLVGSIEEYGSVDSELGTIRVPVQKLDRQSADRTKLLVIDVHNGLEDVLLASDELIDQSTPVICIGNHGEVSAQSLETLVQWGYRLFEHVLEVNVLSALEAEHTSSARWIFALSEEWVQKLTESGFIFVDEAVSIDALPSYISEVKTQPWAKAFDQKWITAPEGEAEEWYFKALDILWEVDQSEELTPAVKAAFSVQAATTLLDIYSANPGNVPVACTLSRAFLNIGKRKDAASILKNAFEQVMTAGMNIDLSLPFMLPLKQQEHGSVSSDAHNWLKIKVAEAWLLLQHSTTYFLESREIKLLKRLNGSPESLSAIKKIGDGLLANGEILKTDPVVLKPNGKFVHLCLNHVYAQSLSDLIEHSNANSNQEHWLYVEKHSAIDGYSADLSMNDKAEFFDSLHDMAVMYKRCLSPDVDAVFFHGIFLDWQKKLVKQIGSQKYIGWIMWGGDLYSPIKDGQPMRFLTGLVDSIHTFVDGDVSFFKDNYGNRDSYPFGYPYAGLYGDVSQNQSKQDPPLIIVGNSGDRTNNHLEALEILASKPDINNYRILLPVSYNLGPEYEEEILSKIKKLRLESITTIKKEFLAPHEYVNLLAEASIFIGIHNRQQAIGNILGALFGGTQVFIRKEISINDKSRENPTWTFLSHHGFDVMNFDDLKSAGTINELSPISEEQMKMYRKIILNDFGIEIRSKQLIESCQNILEKKRSTHRVEEVPA